ncbi:MAG: IclR family transcriptional regulator [Eubacteriales bacterium]|nr:IclR family transcriptional regulator [Eubacteriales bacterium]
MKVEKQSKSNQSVEKTIRIIETLANAADPLRLSQIAASVDMPASTVLRMLNTLIECGYAYQETSELKRYGLTMRFAMIGQLIAERFSIRNISHSYLLDLAHRTGESCCLAIDDHGKVRYLDVVEANQSLITIRQRVGGSAMMHCTGSGKLFLSQYSSEQLEAFMKEHNMPALTSHTLTTPEELNYELDSVRRQGFAYDDEECEIGMKCLAGPIYDSKGKIIATLSLSGPISRMSKRRIEMELTPILCDTANQITAAICGEAGRAAKRSI